MMLHRLRDHLNSYKYAVSGIFHVLKGQSNIWVMAPVGVLVLIVAWYLQVEPWEWAVLILTIGLVLAVELFNTAIEAMLNVVERKYNVDVKVTKDVAAGAVLIVCLAAVVVGVIVFGKRVF